MPKPDIDSAAIRSILQRAFPGMREQIFERMSSGGSTQVYRVQGDAQSVYLRFGEEPEDTFAPEAFVHERLLELGATVPGILYLEDQAPEAGLSVMITSEIAGHALSASGMGSAGAHGHNPEILRAAGRDLALINSIQVDGFGFIERSNPWNGKLAGKHRSFQDWTRAILGEVGSLHRWFIESELSAIEQCVEACIAERPDTTGWLVHGDFDTGHIFAANDRYRGLIDFGEIRGADRWYDVADFIVHANLDRDTDAIAALLSGYRERLPIEADDASAIEQRAVSLGAAMMIRIRDRDHPEYQTDLMRSIQTLLRGEVLSSLVGK